MKRRFAFATQMRLPLRESNLRASGHNPHSFCGYLLWKSLGSESFVTQKAWKNTKHFMICTRWCGCWRLSRLTCWFCWGYTHKNHVLLSASAQSWSSTASVSDPCHMTWSSHQVDQNPTNAKENVITASSSVSWCHELYLWHWIRRPLNIKVSMLLQGTHRTQDLITVTLNSTKNSHQSICLDIPQAQSVIWQNQQKMS